MASEEIVRIRDAVNGGSLGVRIGNYLKKADALLSPALGISPLGDFGTVT